VTHDEVVEDLPSLLTGELGRAQLAEVAAHLRGCAECRIELVEVATAHGALASARHMLADLERVEPVATLDTRSPEPLPPLPPLRASGRAGTQRGVLTGLVAAAVVVALAIGGLAASDRWPFSSRNPSVAGRQAVLAPVPGASGDVPVASASGVVRMTGPGARTDMTIRTSGLPPAARGQFYYAWLLDPKTNKMLPLGVVAADSSATFEVQSDLVGRYSAVDISLQADDGNPVHSPVSVLRATYA
jgi:anti-sigma-K factor RskA/putative zinc finger protein